MKIVFSFISVVLTALIVSCASQQVTSFWLSPEASRDHPYTSVFLLAISGDIAARSIIETDLASEAAKLGITAFRSVDYFPGTFKADAAPSNQEVLAKVKELGCEAIFTVSLLSVQSEQRYVAGTTSYAYDYVPRFDYYGNFSHYYRYTYPVIITPGYYTTDKTYFIESNFYDAETEMIQWSMQSSAYNPSSVESFSKEYTKLLIKRLEAENKASRSK